MQTLDVTHCILLALAVGMLASSGTHAAPSPAPTIGGTTAQAGCPTSTNTAAAGQGRSSGFVGFRLDDAIQPGSSCAWTIEAPSSTTSSASTLVIVARRVEDLSANTKITSAMFNATILANAGGNSSASASSSITSGKKESSLSSSASVSKSADRRRRQAADDDDDDDDDSKQGSSKSTSKSSKTSDAPTASNDDDDASSKEASSKSKSKSSKKSDADDDDDSSNKGRSKSKSKSSGSGSRHGAAHNTNDNGDHQAQKDTVVVVGATPVKVSPHSKQNSRLVIQASRAVPSSSIAAKVVVGVRYTYTEAASLRATLRDVPLSGTQGTLVIGRSTNTKRQSTRLVTFADATDSSLVLSCANAEYFVKVNSVSGTAAGAADSVAFIGDMSQSSSTCTYTAPSSSGSSNTWTAAYGSQACVGAQFIVNYKTTSKSSSTASIQVDYTCEPEAVANEEVNGAQVHKTEPNKQGEDKSAEIAVVIAAVAVALVVVVIVVVVCCYFKNRTSQQQKRRQEGIDVQASHHHQGAADDSLSRPSSAMSEDTTVAMDRSEAATRENAIAVGAVAEEDDHCSITVTAAKTAADLAFEHKKLTLVEDGDLHPYTPQEPLKDQGEEVTRSSRLTTRSSAGSCGSYGSVDTNETPRPNLILNNDDE